ncbi:MAG: hypothetical protein WCQ72_07520 [Eubacteriales bacterium]
MIIYAIICAAAAAALFIVGAKIYRGNIGLINPAHTKNVKAPTGYCRELGAQLIALGVTLTLSAASSFIPDVSILLPLVVMAVGMIEIFIKIYGIQKRYNSEK